MNKCYKIYFDSPLNCPFECVGIITDDGYLQLYEVIS
jgi:hypothetical protein